MKTFFTSDPHFYHANIIKFCNRPYSNTHEMNEALIANWNRKVSKADQVYLLGDVSFGSPGATEGILGRLNGKIHLIKGNHDKSGMLSKIGGRFTSINDYLEITVQSPVIQNKKHNQKIVLFHYPIESWNGKHKGYYHLHGHSHGNVKSPGILREDAGVDSWNYEPFSFEKLYEHFSKKDLNKPQPDSYSSERKEAAEAIEHFVIQ